MFNIIGIASRTLKENGMSEEAKEMSSRVFASGSYDEAIAPEKLSALTMYMKQKNTSAEAELEKYAEQLYQKNVPQNVRDFIDMMSEQSEQKAKKRSEQKKSSDDNEVIAADIS